ncbi:response regulator transcription factor [Agrobacterium arsenijevicii]
MPTAKKLFGAALPSYENRQSNSSGRIGHIMLTSVPNNGHGQFSSNFHVVEHSKTMDASVRKLAIIDDRALDRECLAQSLIAYGLDMEVELFSSLDEWRNTPDCHHTGILVNVGRNGFSDDGSLHELREFIADFPYLPVVILAENRDLRQVMRAFDVGVRGYISSAIGLAVCVGAISLALAGGAFVSAENLSDLRQLLVVAEDKERQRTAMFTQREVDVINALTQGKPNKIIAYELNLRESTVKVHVRNIMKKVDAKNRTEVIFKISDLFKN